MIRIETRQLPSGLTVVLEPIPNVMSVALRWLLPIGSATDPDDQQGLSTLLSELIFRGAGGLNSREFSDAMDRIGVQRTSHLQSHHLQLNATVMVDRLFDALELIVTMVRQPALPADGLDPVRSLSLQALESLEDDPQQLVMLRLSQQHLPSPFNRTGYGEADVLRSTQIDALRAFWTARCRPGNCIIGLAGNIEPDETFGKLESMLEDWSDTSDEPAELGPARRGMLAISQSTAQVHIGVAFDAPREADDDSMLERLAIGVLSGSTSGRLFSEVRQKRSLCYSVGGSYQGGRDRGMVTMYAGTTPERAQETLDVIIGEIMRLKEGVEAEEFNRVVTGIKSKLIMQGESTPARATTITHDMFRIGRPRNLDEIASKIDSISLEQLNDYLASRDFGEFTIASVGPVELNSPGLGV